MIEHGVYALVGYALGFIALVRTDWVRGQGVRMQRKHPHAFSSRLAERTWYPTFIRSIDVILLLSAAILTLEFVFQALGVL
jgi:hypothetical protein